MNAGTADAPCPPHPTASRALVLVRALLAETPEYVYFKDREGRFLAVSASLVTAYGRSSAAEVVGRTDFDFFPEPHARAALADEQRVMASGEPLVNKLEQEFWPTGAMTWVLTTKLPLRTSSGEVIGTCGISTDVTERKRLEQELEKAHRDLLDASRVAGMAEVATGVLHNVGNVLNSLNVSASVIATGLRQSKAESLARVVGLLDEHPNDLDTFLSLDPKGRRVPEFISSLAAHAMQERDRLMQELALLEKNIEHMKEIVAMQQAYATMIGVVEPLDARALMEDALRMNSSTLQRKNIGLVRTYETVPRVVGEQSKVLQILVNLIRNAALACEEAGTSEPRVQVAVRRAPGDRIQLTVADNGVGIPAENLTRIFQHGFTTRAKGHGFGLHSAANAAREMKGTLAVHSDGRGLGATFTLELPAAAATAQPAS